GAFVPGGESGLSLALDAALLLLQPLALRSLGIPQLGQTVLRRLQAALQIVNRLGDPNPFPFFLDQDGAGHLDLAQDGLGFASAADLLEALAAAVLNGAIALDPELQIFPLLDAILEPLFGDGDVAPGGVLLGLEAADLVEDRLQPQVGLDQDEILALEVEQL